MLLAVQKVRVKSSFFKMNCTNGGALNKLLLWSCELLRCVSRECFPMLIESTTLWDFLFVLF